MERAREILRGVATEIIDAETSVPETAAKTEPGAGLRGGQKIVSDKPRAISTIEITPAPATTEINGRPALWATNLALKLASVTRQNPRKIAETIAEKLTAAGFQATVAGPGFINFIPSDEYFFKTLKRFNSYNRKLSAEKSEKNISHDEYLRKPRKDQAPETATKNPFSESFYAGKMVVCEFSDPNPFKVLHIGHLYTSVVGEAIARLIENASGKVARVNFGGDVGLHVGKTLWALEHAAFENSAADQNAVIKDSKTASRTVAAAETLTIDQLARAYIAGSRAYEEDAAAAAEIRQINQAVYKVAEILNRKFGAAKITAENNFGQKTMAQNDFSQQNAAQPDQIPPENFWRETFGDEAELAKLYFYGRKISYEYFEEFYRQIGVNFTRYYPESTVAELGLKTVREHIPEVYRESNGAVVFEGEKFGLHTRVFINQAGLPTYEAKDVGLILRKFQDWRFDESIVITGNDIVEYMKVVLKSVEQFAPEPVERTRHLTHGNVRLPGNEKMSSRKGNFVKATDVLEKVETLARHQHVIALGAIKYALLKYKIGGDFEFDAEKSVATTGDSGVYLQYAAVRAKKILSKVSRDDVFDAAEKFGGFDPAFDGFEPAEQKLLNKLAQYRETVRAATVELAPHQICVYLYDLTQEFSRFYEQAPVAGNPREKLRAQIVGAYLAVLEHGLNLLGIETPEEM